VIRIAASEILRASRHKSPVVACLLGAMLVWCQEGMGDPDASLAAVKQTYDKGDYREVIKLCQQALRADPRQPQLHYYLANSLMLTGSREEARAEYAQTISLSKDERLNQFCSKALASLEEKSAVQDKPSARPSNKPGTNDNDLPAVPEPDWRNVSAEDKAHVTVEGEGSTADRAYKDVMWCLSHLPRRLKDALWSENVQMIICINIGDLSKAKGWTSPPLGFSDWGLLHGITDHKFVYVAQTAGLGKRYIVKRPGWVSFHELGHAFDYNVGRHPHHPDMQVLYDQDRAAQKPGTKFHNQIPAELFADLCAGITSQAGGAYDQELADKFAGQKSAYPRCWNFTIDCLTEYGVTVPR